VCARRQRVARPPERGRQAITERQYVRQRRRAATLLRSQPPYGLDQGERVAAGGDHQRVDQPGPDLAAQELRRVGDRQAGQRQRPHAVHDGRGVRLGPGRDEERDRVVPETAGDERQHRERLPVDPLSVVDRDQHGCRSAAAASSDSAPAATRNRSPWPPARPSRRGRQRVPLRTGHRVQPVSHRKQQRQQGPVPQGELGRYAGGAQHQESGRRPGRGVEQGRLADARLAHQAQARARPCRAASSTAAISASSGARPTITIPTLPG
jgi:hypothetical protein